MYFKPYDNLTILPKFEVRFWIMLLLAYSRQVSIVINIALHFIISVFLLSFDYRWFFDFQTCKAV